MSPAPPAGRAPAPATSGNDTLARLAALLESRKPANGGNPAASYAARLFDKGTEAILKKIGEEATETVMAGMTGDPRKIVYEIADLWFHSLVALSHFGLAPADVLAELERREGLSGLEEFARRGAPVGAAGAEPAPGSGPASVPAPRS